MFLLVLAYPSGPGQRAIKWLCVEVHRLSADNRYRPIIGQFADNLYRPFDNQHRPIIGIG